jgi:DNA-binding transcriptional LysR family regulator
VLGPRREIAFREVLDHDFVGFVAGSALQKTLNHHAARAGRRLKLRVRLNSFDSIARMVESGIGLAVLPETAVTVCVQNLRSLSAHAQRLVEYLSRHSPTRQ